VSLTGESGYSGHTTQSRTSYLESEVFWGYQFTNIVNYDYGNECYVADVTLIDEIKRVEMPQCSAKEFETLINLK
jgi:Inward rectifier potassium channel C-terminal domain